MTYTLIHKAEEPHKCDYDRMFADQRREDWPDYSIIECDGCGKQFYYVMKKSGTRFINDIHRWNRARIERKAGLR